MMWAKGLNERDRAREMETWGMQAVKEVFGFAYNDVWSSAHCKDIGHEKPNVCHLMPVRFFTGSPLEFSKVKANLKTQSNKSSSNSDRARQHPDLGQRFVHPC